MTYPVKLRQTSNTLAAINNMHSHLSSRFCVLWSLRNNEIKMMKSAMGISGLRSFFGRRPFIDAMFRKLAMHARPAFFRLLRIDASGKQDAN